MRLAEGLPLFPALFTDGGCIGRNPTRHGGTWAWARVKVQPTGFEAPGEVGVEDDEYGLILPKRHVPKLTARPPESLVIRLWEVDSVESNQSELMALARGIDALPDGWSGRICADNENALRRLVNGIRPSANIPDAVRDRFYAARDRLGDIEPVLMAGHPSAEDLRLGYVVKTRGDGSHVTYPVSPWNVYVDSLCWKAREEAARIGIRAPSDDPKGAAKSAARVVEQRERLRDGAAKAPPAPPPVFGRAEEAKAQAAQQKRESRRAGETCEFDASPVAGEYRGRARWAHGWKLCARHLSEANRYESVPEPVF